MEAAELKNWEEVETEDTEGYVPSFNVSLRISSTKEAFTSDTGK